MCAATCGLCPTVQTRVALAARHQGGGRYVAWYNVTSTNGTYVPVFMLGHEVRLVGGGVTLLANVTDPARSSLVVGAAEQAGGVGRVDIVLRDHWANVRGVGGEAHWLLLRSAVATPPNRPNVSNTSNQTAGPTTAGQTPGPTSSPTAAQRVHPKQRTSSSATHESGLFLGETSVQDIRVSS